MTESVPINLPTELPIFPLSGALLLPHGHLPLHIFEPRYLNLVEEALGAGRVMGMIQPKEVHTHPTPDTADLYAVGCAGRIVSFSEMDDGRLLITLRGIKRFRLADELPLYRGFRRIIADYTPYDEDRAEPPRDTVDRSRLIAAARAYLKQREMTCDWQAVQGASDLAVVTSLAMMCQFEPHEKQALLECENFVERAGMLISLLEMGAHSAEPEAPTTRH